MAKAIKAVLKLQILAGKATPTPPVGPALGQHGVNIQDFCSKFNAATADKPGEIVPVEITIYQDRSFDLVYHISPVSDLLRRAAGIEKGSGNPSKVKVGKVTRAQIKEIANKKMPDLNANSIEAAMKIVEGAAKSMGIDIIE